MTLGDMIVVIEAFLRPAEADQATRLAERLVDFYQDILAGLPLPAHRPQGWSDRIEEFRQRFARARMAAPQAPSQATAETAKRVFELLPIHPSLRRQDFDIIANDLSFNMVACWQNMERRIDRAAIIALLARA